MYELKKLDEGQYWDDRGSCNPIVVNECRCEVGDSCWHHIMTKRFGGESGWFPDRLDKISVKGKPKVFAMCWRGDIGWDQSVFGIMNIHRMLCVINGIQSNRIYNYKKEPHTFLFLSKWPENLVDVFAPFKDVPGIWPGTTITGANQKTDLRRMAGLSKFKGFKIWLSIEPLMGYPGFLKGLRECDPDQIIVGAESGKQIYSYDEACPSEWMLPIVHTCDIAEISCFVKQVHLLNGKPSKNINDWPEDLRVRELAWNK